LLREDIDLVPLGGGELLRRGTLRKRLTTARQDFWWYPFGGRRAARRANADIYHCLAPRAPLVHGRPPTIVTIQDLVSFRFPGTLTRWTRFYERATLRRVASSADFLIASSSDTAADIAGILSVPEERIRIVPLGVDFDFFSAPASTPKLPFPYVLFVGAQQPRKNLERLKAAVELVSRTRDDLRLVIAGSDGWGAVSLGTDSRVHFAGRVTQEELRSLYQHAECLALVSIHEGFGLPVLEAMAAGTPVVASNVAALPETAGGAAALVDPMSVEAIAEGIRDAIDRRDELIARGRRRAATCSWAATTELTVKVYRELLSR